MNFLYLDSQTNPLACVVSDLEGQDRPGRVEGCSRAGEESTKTHYRVFGDERAMEKRRELLAVHGASGDDTEQMFLCATNVAPVCLGARTDGGSSSGNSKDKPRFLNGYGRGLPPQSHKAMGCAREKFRVS